MFGLSKSVTLALVGWLWADILLGLFVIFLAAASPPVRNISGPNVDPDPVEISVPVNGAALLGTDEVAIAAERAGFADRVKAQLAAKAETRRVALVFAYGSHEDPTLGERIAERATAALGVGQFEGAAVKSLHDIVPGDRGSAVVLEIYLYR